MGPLVILAYFSGPLLMLVSLTTFVSDPSFDRAARSIRALRRFVRRARGREVTPPAGRPIESIAYDMRRLGRLLQDTHDGRSTARIAVIRQSYDDVLAEGCAALGMSQLLGVLDSGPELDHERRRVEVVLVGAGMVLAEVY